MPQDGSNNYQYPPGTRGVPDQTIESEAYNTFLDDLVVNDLNIARPIHRGGTGATTANAAIFNLGGERAGAIVTNYDSHLWMPGSFYSAASATGAPVPGRAFVGIAYSSDPPAEPPANLNVIIEARDQNDTTVPGRVHIREKKAGVWGVWKGEDRLGVQTTPPSTVNSPDGALWWDNDNGVLYVNYNDGNTTQWVQAVALPQIDVGAFVAKSGDTMTGPLILPGAPTVDLHAATKQYVDGGVDGVTGGLNSKAGVEALAYSGMQINGSMEVSQENGQVSTTVANAASYILDGYGLAMLGATGSISGAQVSLPTQLPGYTSSLAISCTVVPNLAGATDGVWIYQWIEGYRWSRLAFGTANAKPVTIGFWILPPLSGTMAVALHSGSRVYVIDVPVTALVWQFKTVTIPGDVLGTWKTDNTSAVRLSFCFGAGSGRKVAANTWLAASDFNAIATSATTNFITTVATNILFITGVTVLPGIYAPTAAQSSLLMRPYDQELVTCQRYWYAVPGGLVHASYAPAGGGILSTFKYGATVRALPTITGVGVGYSNASAMTAYQTGISQVQIQIIATAAGTAYATFSAITCDARL